MEQQKRGIVVVGPAWHSCGSYQLFKSQIDTYQSLGFEAYFVAIPTSTRRGDNSEEFWDYYLRMTSDLPATDRGQAKVKRSSLHSLSMYVELVRCLGRTVCYYRTFPARFAILPDTLRGFLSSHRVSVVHCNHYFNLPAARRIRDSIRNTGQNTRIILETHDIQSRHLIDIDPQHPLTGLDGKYNDYFADELRCSMDADEFVHLNEDESSIFGEALPNKKHHLIYPSVARPISKTSKQPDIDFLIVSSANMPNYRSLCWFLDEVWDDEINSIASLRVVGNVDYIFQDEKDQRYEKYRSIFVGRVENLSDWYRRARTVVIPVTEGQGIAVKTLEAMSYGRPFLYTPMALRGFSSRPEAKKLFGACRDAAEFKKALRKRLSSSRQKEVNKPALDIYNSLFSPEVYREKIRNLIFDGN